MMGSLCLYRIVDKFGIDNVCQKWMDEDFGEEKFGELIDWPIGY